MEHEEKLVATEKHEQSSKIVTACMLVGVIILLLFMTGCRSVEPGSFPY